ncbi:MAG: GNAT family N-acetyltransferase, partial [Rhodobacteraceae bacterium]|nr:GNAT family N-acetyltransferase [Paracoccaceae bacterium]
GPEPEDYPDFQATFTSYRARFMGGPLNAYEAWMLYATKIGHWAIRGYGMWMIHDRDNDKTYGLAGGLKPDKWPEAEIAWIIWPESSGHGIALEATHAARAYFYDTLGWQGAVKDKSPSIDGNDAAYRHPAPDRLKGSQLAHGIEMGISHYQDPLFKSKGWAID